jgi:putative transposase
MQAEQGDCSSRRMRKLETLASTHNHVNQERSLSSRAIFKLNHPAGLAEWCCLL